MKHMKFFKQACIGIVAFAATIVPCMNVFASNAAAESTSTKQEEAVDDYYIYDRTVTIGAVYGAGYSAEKQGWQVIVNFKRVPTQEDIAHGLSETLEFAKPIFDYSENKGRWEQEFSLKGNTEQVNMRNYTYDVSNMDYKSAQVSRIGKELTKSAENY